MSQQQPTDLGEDFWREFLEQGGDTWKAAAGEVLVSTDAAARSDLDASLERRTLDLKGKSSGTDVVSVRIGPG